MISPFTMFINITIREENRYQQQVDYVAIHNEYISLSECCIAFGICHTITFTVLLRNYDTFSANMFGNINIIGY